MKAREQRSMDSKHEEDPQRRAHVALVEAFKAIGEVRRPFGPMEVSSLVSPRNRPEFADTSVVRGVNRDAIIAGLMSKAARTQLAVATLADAGLGVDAYALSRVLLENIIVVAWLVCEDKRVRRNRIDTYIHHFEAFKVRLDEVIALYAAQRGEPPTAVADDRAREIAEQVFENRWTHWAWMPRGHETKKSLVRLREMAKEVGVEETYDLEYFKMSSFVHSAPSSVWDAMANAEHVLVDTSSPEQFGTTALALTNAMMLHLLGSVNRYFNLGFEKRVAGIYQMLDEALATPDSSSFGSSTAS